MKFILRWFLLSQEVYYNVDIKNALIEYFISHTKNSNESISLSSDDCENLINESINLDSSLDNDIYELKYNFLKIKKEEVNHERNPKLKNEKIDKINLDIQQLIESVKKINKFHKKSITLRKNYVLDSKDIDLINNFIDEIQEIKLKVSKERANILTSILAKIYSFISSQNIETYKNIDKLDYKIIENFFKNYQDDEFKSKNISFFLEKIKYNISKNKGLDEIYNILDITISLPDSFSKIKELVQTFNLIKDQRLTETIENFIKKNKVKIKNDDFAFCMSDIENAKLDYQKSLDYLKKYYDMNILEPDDYIKYIYSSLLAKEYSEVLKFIQLHKIEISNLDKETRDVFLINEITAKKYDAGILTQEDKSKLEEIIARCSDDKRLFIAANSLLEKNPVALHHIKEYLKYDMKLYYELIEWPAINDSLKADIKQYFEESSQFKARNPAA